MMHFSATFSSLLFSYLFDQAGYVRFILNTPQVQEVYMNNTLCQMSRTDIVVSAGSLMEGDGEDV